MLTLFLLCGVTFASWASRLPAVKQNLAIDDFEVGVLLFAGVLLVLRDHRVLARFTYTSGLGAILLLLLPLVMLLLPLVLLLPQAMQLPLQQHL